MRTSLILGYGNVLRSDDGFGVRLAHALRERISGSGVAIVDSAQLTPELAEPVSRSSRVLFLDASHESRPGEILIKEVRRSPTFTPAGVSHHLSPAELLELAYRYYGAEPEAFLLTVGGQNFELGENLSPILQKAWKPCLERVLDWVHAL